MNRRIVFVPPRDKFSGVTREEKILQINVAEQDLLMAALESVQPTVRVLFQKLKICGVVLHLVRVQVTENPNRGLLVNKKEAAKIGVELLDAGTEADEIIIRADIVELYLGERLLQPDMSVEAVGAASHVRSDVAGGRHTARVESRIGGCSQVKENLLPQA